MGRTATRSVYLDALRAFALARVVIYHATSLWTVTAFTAMPLMFFIAGSLYAASLERRATRQVVIDRYRRILLPYWVYVAAMVVLWAAMGVIAEVTPINWVGFIMPVLSLNGPKGPPGPTLELTWIALWYLQMHLILSLIGGWMRRAQQRNARRYFIVLVALTAVLLPVGVGAAFFYALCWSIGYLQHDGVLEDWLRTRWKFIALATGPLGAAAFFAFHESASNAGLAVAALGTIALGVFWLVLALGLRARIEPALDRRWVRSLVHWMSSRSLTVYLWHMVVIFATIELALPGAESGLARLAWCVALLPVTAVVVGWAEDLAARRRPTLWPRLPVTLPAPGTEDTAAAGDAVTPQRTQPAAQSVPKMRSPASPRPGSM